MEVHLATPSEVLARHLMGHPSGQFFFLVVSQTNRDFTRWLADKIYAHVMTDW
jgi:hypothetical protein